MKKSKTLRNISSVIIIILLLFVCGCSGTKFTAEGWSTADQSGRQNMIRSLMREYDPVGWTESDIINLLGPKTSSDPDFCGSLRGYDTDNTLVYALGEYGFSNVRMLVISLDQDRIVTKWEVVTVSM